MAAVSIKFSQNTVDQLYQSELNNAVLNGSIGGLIDAIIISAEALQSTHTYFSSYTQLGSTLRLNHADGAVTNYTGLVLANPEASSGAASATGVSFSAAGLATFAQSGTFYYNYAASGDGLSISPSATPSTITSIRLATQLPTYSSAYDPLLGNVSINVQGAISHSGDQLNGSISSVTLAADKFLLSSIIEGDFRLSGDDTSIGLGLTHSSVTGTLTGFTENYRDGSVARVTGMSTYIDAKQQLDQTLLAQASRFAGNDDISVDLPGRFYKSFDIAAGSGDDRVSLKGGGGYLNVDAGSGNDVVTLLGGAHRVDGGAGRDAVVMGGARAAFGVTKVAGGVTVTDSAGSASTLVNVERIVFSDTTLAFDTDGSAGQAYRLYQAAFNRAPDSAGLGFHIAALDAAVPLAQVARGFIDSPEFARTYGALNNTDFVTQLYANVLHRAPDAEGLKFHVDLLNAGTVTRAQDLVGFSESPENQAALIGIIGNGFAYTAYAG